MLLLQLRFLLFKGILDIQASPLHMSYDALLLSLGTINRPFLPHLEVFLLISGLTENLVLKYSFEQVSLVVVTVPNLLVQIVQVVCFERRQSSLWQFLGS